MQVKGFTFQSALAFAITALIISSCNMGATPAPTLDVNAISTAAVETAVAQFNANLTQTALAVPPTAIPTNTSLPTFAAPPTLEVPTDNPLLPTVVFNTPIAGFTQLAGAPSLGQPSTASGCNDAILVAETLPDKSVVKAGKQFIKSWDLQNTGTCTWDEGYVFAFLPDVSDSAIKGYDIKINNKDDFVKPGKGQAFIVKIIAPDKPGKYRGYWKMKDDTGKYFGQRVYLEIIVK